MAPSAKPPASGILDRDEVVYIERYQEGHARLGVDIRVGSRIPAYCTAIGHSILASSRAPKRATFSD